MSMSTKDGGLEDLVKKIKAGSKGGSEEERDKDFVREENRYCQAIAQGSTGRT